MKHLFKRSLALLCVLAMLIGILPMALAAEGTEAEFVVLSTTDMHGRCWDKNVLNDTNATNTMLNVATAVAGVRAEYDNVILLDNGDTYQGTPVSTYQLSLQQLGETELPNPMALSMKEIGYDAATVGNHEFNYSWNLMNEVRAYLADETKGNPVASLCANLYYDGTDGVHEAGENVFTPYMFKEFTLGEKTYKVAIIGFENTDCPRWDVPDNYPGIVFTHPENTTGSMALEAQKYVAEVKALGADAVIVAYHSGLGDGAAPEDIEFGVNSENQILSIIKYNTGIDLVIAGHDHSTGYSGKSYKDAENNDVMVVNGGGNNLTKTVFAVNEEGKLYVKSNENIPLKSNAADAELKAKIQPYVDLASTYVNQECGTILPGSWSTSTNFYLQQTDTMDIIGRAQMATGTKYLAQKYDTEEKLAALYEATGLDHLTVDMSSTSVVVSGGYTVQPGTMTMKKIYQLYKYDNTLYLIPLTGQEIKDIMEFNASQRLAVNTGSGSPVFSCIGDNFTNPVFYGLDFQYDMSEEVGNRVEITGFANGNEFDLEKTYIFAINNYHLGNGPFANYSTADAIWSQTDDLGGGVVQDLIAEWIKDETAANGGVSPAPSDWKLVYDKEIEAGVATGDYILDLVTDPSTLEAGDTVAVLNAANTVLLTNTAAGTKLAPATDVTTGGTQIGTNSANALFTVELDENGYIHLVDADGKYVTSGATGNSLTMADASSDLSAWETEAAEGGFYLHNIGAAYNGNHNQYFEYYGGGFTTYGLQSGGAAYLVNLYKLEKEANTTTIEVFSTTDVHGYLVDTSSGNEATFQYRLAYIANIVNAARENAENDDVLLLDGGDIYQGTPVSNLTYGHALRAAYDAMGYDAVSLGNHEFDWDVKTYAADENGTMPAYTIGEFSGDSDIPVLAYNLYDTGTTNRASFVKDYVVLNKAGLKVVVLGYIPDYSMDIMAAKIAPYDIDQSIENLNAKIAAVEEAEAPDVFVVLAHASPKGLAGQLDADVVDLVVGGHSHSSSVGVAENGLAYIQGNCQAKGYANAKIIVDNDTGEVTVENPSYVNTTSNNAQNLYDTEGNTKLDPVVLAISHASWDAVKEEMSEVLGTVDQSITRRVPIGESSSTIAGNWLTRAMLLGTKDLNTVVAITNSGGIRCDLLMAEGETTRNITVGDIYAISPFGNRLFTYDITGAELAKTVENSFTNSNYGDQFSGMVVTYTAEPDTVGEDGRPIRGARTVVSITLDDGTVVDITDEETLYRVVINEYCATLPGSVFENKTPVQDVNEAPIDNITTIEVLRAEGLANEGKLYLDLTERCIKVEPAFENPFTDVEEGVWYYDYVMEMAEAGILKGVTETTFAPNNSLTRAQLVTILYRVEGEPAVEGECPFEDVADGLWYTDAIIWAAQKGIVNGTTETTFSPDRKISREQIATILYRWAKAEKVEEDHLAEYPDADDVSAWAVDAMNWAVAEGLISGSDGKLIPLHNATRAQIAAILSRYLNK